MSRKRLTMKTAVGSRHATAFYPYFYDWSLNNCENSFIPSLLVNVPNEVDQNKQTGKILFYISLEIETTQKTMLNGPLCRKQQFVREFDLERRSMGSDLTAR